MFREAVAAEELRHFIAKVVAVVFKQVVCSWPVKGEMLFLN